MRLLDEIAGIGRDPATGGYLRYAWTAPELQLRDWFRDQAASRSLSLEEDGNGNLFSWWGTGSDAILTGSHFDSVPHGGAFDGPLGIVSAFLAVDLLRERGFEPRQPIGIVAFAEEEGSRFGVACLGSRLLTGAIDPSVRLVDRDGVALRDVIQPEGKRPDILDRIGCFIELHIEQGRALDKLAAGSAAEAQAATGRVAGNAVGVASAIWPHGRWRLDFTGVPNHAGTTLMSDRHDPMLTFAFTVLAANKEARLRGAHATIGRVAVSPNATNAIASNVTAWLDARAAATETVEELVKAIETKAAERAARDGTHLVLTPESISPETAFDTGLRDRVAARLGGAPILPTGAGHDAGVLSAHVPTAMLFVRNPTGVSHSPAEHADDEDCEAGVTALADVLQDLAC